MWVSSVAGISLPELLTTSSTRLKAFGSARDAKAWTLTVIVPAGGVYLQALLSNSVTIRFSFVGSEVNEFKSGGEY